MAGRIAKAIEELKLGPLRGLQRAPLYLTTPITRVAAPDQPRYVNTVAVAQLAPPLEPDADAARRLVGWCKRLEVDAGRDLGAPVDSPRPLDIDLLVLGSLRVELSALSQGYQQQGSHDRHDPWWPGEIVVPHPRILQRRFVLRPLCDLLPELQLPAAFPGEPRVEVREALAALEPRAAEQRVDPLPEPSVRDNMSSSS
ncbi:MAG: 2-amino-4-hydroxy-6-hydroxymethyldihydropteridine diphosphokinase [Thermoanaerobaculia bacterium]|nr:2-amino-4-hydroxy-6-hydroxymethyldihydropteridine diphosphokinase [Thermoanaerobaculia bacterium]